MRDGKHVILCVDDDAEFLESISALLEQGGYAVVTAADAGAGLAKFRRAKPDLVLVDLIMEQADSGVELARQLRARDAKVPIYMLSSAGDGLTMAVDYASLGLDGVLQKPVSPDTLLPLLKAKLRAT